MTSLPTTQPPTQPGTRQRRRPYTPRVPAAQRRDQVLDAALQIIARDGYGAVSIEAIARELDVTRPVIYNVFDGLSELLQTLLDRQERRALDQLIRRISVVPPDADLRRYLTGTIRELVGMVIADPLTWSPVFVSAEDTPPMVRRRVARDRELIRARIASLVESWLASSATRRPPLGEPVVIDSEIVAHMLVAMGEYFGRLILTDPHAVDGERLAIAVSALFAPRPH